MQSPTPGHMTGTERRIALALAGTFSSRMLGLFMILPVFTLYATELEGYTMTLAGLAMGIYGFTQAIFQIPMGMLSDRIGRKPVIIAGLVVFALGSVVAAMSDTMIGVIMGRALQGAGAIASAVMALAADLTREEHRIKVMALIGISIGLSFAVAMVAGPILHGWFGVPGIFWTTALLAVGGIIIILTLVPKPVISRFHRDTELELNWFHKAVKDSQLLRADIGIFILHLNLMATFVVVPRLLQNQLGMDVANHWKVYLPVLGLSMLIIAPFIILAEKKRKVREVLIGAVLVLILSQIGLDLLSGTVAGMVFVLLLFFCAFNLLEATLPSLVAKLAPVAHKGTAMGVYTTSQFLGIFAGGLAGGWISQHWDANAVFIFNALTAAVWLFLAYTMRQPQYLSSQLLNLGEIDKTQAQILVKELTAIEGVEEATIIAEDGIAFLKVDRKKLDMEALYAYSAAR